MEWYPAPPTLQIKIRSVISPTSDFDKVHQLPFAKHEYLKIFVKIIYSHGVNKFCKNYKNNFAKNYKKSIWPLEARNCASSGRKLKTVYYFNLAGTNNLLLKAFIYCGRGWLFCCCCWCWRGCSLPTPANFIFVFLC